jgi:hypothetical protein
VAELRAVDVLPIDWASKVALGIAQSVKQARADLWARRQEVRYDWARLKLWADRQHIGPDQVLQLVVLVVYGLVALAEAWAYRRKGQD